MPWKIKATGVPDSNQKNVILTDLTGTYSMSNPTGNGAPNPELSQIDIATATFYTPDPTTYLPSTSFITIDLSSYGYPLTGSIVIPQTAFGLAADSIIADGLYQVNITETSTEANQTSTYSFYMIFTKNAQCCIDKLTSSLSGCGCNDKSTKQEMIFKGNLYLSSALYNTFNISKAASNLLSAAEICAKSGCGGCAGC